MVRLGPTHKGRHHDRAQVRVPLAALPSARHSERPAAAARTRAAEHINHPIEREPTAAQNDVKPPTALTTHRGSTPAVGALRGAAGGIRSKGARAAAASLWTAAAMQAARWARLPRHVHRLAGSELTGSELDLNFGERSTGHGWWTCHEHRLSGPEGSLNCGAACSTRHERWRRHEHRHEHRHERGAREGTWWSSQGSSRRARQISSSKGGARGAR